MNRLPADAAHGFGGMALDRTRPLRFRLDGRSVTGFAGDTVLSAVLASGIDAAGRFGAAPLALSPSFAPLVAGRAGTPLPMARLPAVDRVDLRSVGRRRFAFRHGPSLDQVIAGVADAPWLTADADETLATDVLVVGGGLAGLAAAEAAARAGHGVVLAERRPWMGGDARYYGPVGDAASPAEVEAALLERLAALPGVTLWTHSEVFALAGGLARVHRIVEERGRVVAITAARVVLATGSVERLPVFAGNRLPGVVGAIAAYHLAKRYGVRRGGTAIVATGSNFGYRLALRLHDAGIAVARIVDPRVNPQSRFVDFAKASGLTLSGGLVPARAAEAGRALDLAFADAGTGQISLTLTADRLILAGALQPDLTLWMRAGGGTLWQEGQLRPRGTLEHVALAGAAAGWQSLEACAASGRAAVATLFGRPAAPVADSGIDAAFETPPAAAAIGPALAGAPAFLDTGASLIVRAVPGASAPRTPETQAPALGDVAAAVALGLILPADAGAVAEERGAPGADLVRANWAPAPRPASDMPAWLAARFPGATVRVHLVVDGRRRFGRGALVFANTAPPDPAAAIAGIAADPPAGTAGGIALLPEATLRRIDRYIVETLEGPAPARRRETP